MLQNSTLNRAFNMHGIWNICALRPVSGYISEMHIITTEHYWEILCNLSNHVIGDDLDWPLKVILATRNLYGQYPENDSIYRYRLQN